MICTSSRSDCTLTGAVVRRLIPWYHHLEVLSWRDEKPEKISSKTKQDTGTTATSSPLTGPSDWSPCEAGNPHLKSIFGKKNTNTEHKKKSSKTLAPAPAGPWLEPLWGGHQLRDPESPRAPNPPLTPPPPSHYSTTAQIHFVFQRKTRFVSAEKPNLQDAKLYLLEYPWRSNYGSIYMFERLLLVFLLV